MSQFKATIVIPTRNRPELLADALRSILTIDLDGIEVLICDQSADTKSGEVVRALAKGDSRIRYHPTPTIGLAANRNVALQESRGEILAFVDDDCLATPEWISAVLREFAEPAVGAVFGRVLAHGVEERTGTEVAYKPSEERSIFDVPTPPWYIGHGANMSLRRSDLIALGGFDPLLGAGSPLASGDDSDIIYRFLAAGKRVVYCPSALIYHRQWKPWAVQASMERAYGIGAGAQFTKYLRCGDLAGLSLLGTWIWQLGVRRLGAGLLKWRSPKVMYLGYCQLTYPLAGMVKSLRYKVDNKTKMFLP